MRTDEERINAMHSRAKEIGEQRQTRKIRVAQITGMITSLAIVIGLALFASGRAGAVAPGNSPDDMRASVFAANGMLGYIVIGVIAFILGAAVTVFCYSLMAQRNNNGDK